MSSFVESVRFRFVGALGTVVRLGAIALAYDVVGVGLGTSLVIAVGAAVVLDVLLNRTFTFELESGTVVLDGVGAEPA